MNTDQVRELLQHTADCLEIEARWWNNCAHSDSNNRDIGLFAKGIEIGYQRSAKWLNEQASQLEVEIEEEDQENHRQPPSGLIAKAIRERSQNAKI